MTASTFLILATISSLIWLSNTVDEKYYYKLTKDHYETDWLECCNDRFYSEQIMNGATDYYIACRAEFGEDRSSCFHSCFMRMMGVYDGTGFHKDRFMKLFGPDMMLGDSNDWKKQVSEKIIGECFQEIDQKSTHDCNDDVKKFDLCFLHNLFMACPSLNLEKC